MARRSRGDYDPAELRRWARSQLTGLQAAMDGVRTDATREVIATYVNKIVVWPSRKRGEMHLNPASRPLWKDHDRPDGRSWSNAIGATGVGSKPRTEDGLACRGEAGRSLVLAFVWGSGGVVDTR